MGMEIDSAGRCNFVSFRGIDISDEGLGVISRANYELGKQFVIRLPNCHGEQLMRAKIVRKWTTASNQQCIGLKFCTMSPVEQNTQAPAGTSAA